MSKYDSIKTAAELVAEVQLNGLSLAQEDLCRVQDIFGNTAVEELARLANDIGRNNENGEPDPKGTWNSERKATQGTFYMILVHIWNWEEVTRFWNLNTNPEHEALQELRSTNKNLTDENKKLRARRAELLEDQKKGSEYITSLATKLSEANRRAAEAEAEVVRLKAKLYDLLVAEKGV